MPIRRTVLLLVPALIAGTPIAFAAGPAQAATQISPPTIMPKNFPPVLIGTPVTFTFTENGVGTPVAYEYTVNGGKKIKVSAPSGVATVQIAPVRQTTIMEAYAVAADGTVSGATPETFTAYVTPPAADKDMSGDGVPDLLTVGDTAGLKPGLWLASGGPKPAGAAGNGVVRTPAINYGINGDGINPGTDGPADFNGAEVVTGQFTGDGFQDILVYYTSGNSASAGVLLSGSGDGSPLPPQAAGVGIPLDGLADANGDNPLQVANAYTNLYFPSGPDLLATNGDPVNGYYLDYYQDEGPGIFSNSFSIHTPTPDGTADWNMWTLATLTYSGGVGMFLWNESTGALYLWGGVTFKDNGDGTGTVSYTQYLISKNWHKGKPLSTLEAAQFRGSTVPDLRAVTPGGVAIAYRISGLSTTKPAKITAGKPQKLT